MRVGAFALIATLGAACGPDAGPFHVRLELDRTGGQMCPSDVCDGIPMTCDAKVLVRIVDANNEDVSYFSDCVSIMGGEDLCKLATVDLGDRPIPNTMVRVQFAVWPDDGEACDLDIKWDLQGRVITQGEVPAIAGATYLDVGYEEEAVLELGCIDLDELNDPSCGVQGVRVASRVIDFETNLSVSPTIQNLIVSLGEPQFDDPFWSLPTADTVELDRDVQAGFPIWLEPDDIPIDIELQVAACIQVFEDGVGPVSSSLSCAPATPDTTNVDTNGVLVRKATLDMITAALGGTFPPGGLVIGRVVDHTGQFAAGVTIAPSAGTVQFLNDDMTALDSGGVTTSSGAFLSMDAPFDTTWQATLDTASQVEVQLGGLVTGKVTVIELQLSEPVIDP